jgi:nitrite reductase/ring-hydroxylating ferredoxin subunit
MRGIMRYIEDLLASRRPRAFRADPDDVALARTAITLRTARPGSGAPAEEFVTSLHKRLAAELEDTRPEPSTGGRPRRTVIAMTAAAAAAAAVAGAGVDHLLTASAVPQADGEITPDQGTWQAVLASDDLPEATVRAFTLDTLTGFLERRGGRLRAISGICTHQGCRLVLANTATELDCPCHGAVFALDGTVVRHRLSIPIAALPGIAVREHEGSIQVYAPPPPASGPAISGQ